MVRSLYSSFRCEDSLSGMSDTAMGSESDISYSPVKYNLAIVIKMARELWPNTLAESKRLANSPCVSVSQAARVAVSHAERLPCITS